MKKSILSLLLACFLQINLAFAQNVMKGVVSDANGPLVGVVIHDKDNAKGTTSDMSGKYALNGAESGHTIEFRYLGYVTETVVWDGKSVVNIKLKEDAVQLEETVVIGYGSVKKKDLTGAVGVINSSLIEKQSTSQLSQSLQGLIPGLTVTRSSSMPGASATVQVRGVTTMSDSSPLILVDGMMVSSLDNMASEDVQQITVLKDAASASIYGARAAAGVILITTKEATEGQLSIGYNGEISLSSPTEFPKFLTDPYHYMTMYNEWSWNDAGNPAGGEFANYSQDYIDNYATNNRYDPIQYPIYDWKDAILSNTAMRHKHNLTMTYGNKVIKSHTSATYENADAIYKGSNHERISIRSRNNLKISDKLSGSIDFSVRYATKNDPTSGSPIRAAYMYPSIYLGLYPDGRVGPGKDGSLSNTLAALLEGGEKKTVSNTMTGKFSLSYKPIKDLTLTANLTPTVGTVSIKEMKKAIPVYDAYETDVMLGYVSGYTSNSLSEERRNIKSLEKQFIATYDKTFSKVHNFNAMVGYEDYSYTYETMSGSTNDMSLSSFPYLDLANKNALAVAGNSYQNAYRSFFGRVMYNYDSRYYLQLNAREDGSSRFHKDHRWGFFPSASVGWVISNEKFMQNITPINYLKFRASIGTLGNERIGNYPYQTYISFNNAIMYDSAGSTPQSSMSAAQQDYAYENIHWEKTQSWDIGVDAAFFNNRLDFSADYYYKKTTDMLLSVAIPSFTGYSAPDRNVGKMHTRGWEVKLGWSDRIGDVTYAVSFNISDYKSIIDNLNGRQQFNSDGTIITEGAEYNSWYGYKTAGLFQTAEEVSESALLSASTKPGDVKYVDVSGPDGTPDGIINETYDRVGPGKDGSLSNTLAALLEGGEKKTVSNTMTGKFSLSYKPIKDLTLTANLTPTVGTVSIKEMKKAIPVYDAYETDVMLGYVSGYTSNSLSEERRNIKSLEKQFIATYDKTFSKVHNFNAMVGYEDYSYTYETMSGSTNDMSLSSFPYLDLANKNALAVAGNSYQNAYRSFFGRVMYNYDSRYYLQLNAREDGSSRFHKDHRWGFFPSASVGWVISNEKFMQNITPINYLKFRASIGTLGNERIGNYPYQTYISFNNAIMYDSAGSTPQSSMSAAQQDYAYENIHWEKTQSWDIGVDAAFFNNRLDFSADYYYKKTTDMLLSVAIPSFTGYSAPDRNVGKMHTRGWEVKLGWSDRIGDVTYAVSFNISDYKSIIDNLNGRQQFNSDGTIITEGAEYNSWYGYKTAGLFQTAEEVSESALLSASTKPGDVKYVDVSGPDGTPDGIINETYDRVVLGSSLPHYLYGGSISLGWKGLSFSLLFNGVGKQLSRLTESMIRPMQGQWLPAPSVLLNDNGSRNYWSVYNTAEQNAAASYPRLSHQGGEYNNYKMSDYWLKSSAYMRIKNINVGYTVPKKIVSKVGIKGLRVYVNIDDPYCFDSYLSGWDPEAGASTYITRTYTFGVDIKF